jgi:hypothetical protein
VKTDGNRWKMAVALLWHSTCLGDISTEQLHLCSGAEPTGKHSKAIDSLAFMRLFKDSLLEVRQGFWSFVQMQGFES